MALLLANQCVASQRPAGNAVSVPCWMKDGMSTQKMRSTALLPYNRCCLEETLEAFGALVKKAGNGGRKVGMVSGAQMWFTQKAPLGTHHDVLETAAGWRQGSEVEGRQNDIRTEPFR